MTISGFGSTAATGAALQAGRGGGGQRPQSPFARLDTNGDAAVDRVELSAMAEEMAAHGGPSIDVDQEMAEMDANGDGSIDEQEMLDGMESRRPPMGGGPPPMDGGPPPPGGGADSESLFRLLDTNGDGVIDASELSAVSEEMAARGGPSIDVAQQMEELDANGDGAIDEQEMTDGMERRRLEMADRMSQAAQPYVRNHTAIQASALLDTEA